MFIFILLLFKTALILFTNQASIAFDFDHELGSPEDIKASLKSDIKFGGGSSLFPFTNASSAYELATRQILQPCSGRGCRGFRDFDVPLLMISISDGLSIETGQPLSASLRSDC